MSRFYFNDSDSSVSDFDDSTLPYPKPLARSAFLTPDFSPEVFLSSLRDRHQTLEDLRSELRTRSQELNKELLDLVNDNYQEFLTLGSRLKGGDEKVEEVRVSLLGFEGDVEGLRRKVEERRKEVEGLVAERRKIRRNVQLGRGLLEVEEKVGELEGKLMVGSTEDSDAINFDSSESEDDEESVDGVAIPTPRLKRRVQQYLWIRRTMEKLGVDHPFLVQLEERVLRIRQTILLDLSTALGQKGQWRDRDKGRMLTVVSLYGDMGEAEEAIKLLQLPR